MKTKKKREIEKETKVIQVFKEFQREMLKKMIDVKVVFEISNNIREKFNIKFPKKTRREIIKEARKRIV